MTGSGRRCIVDSATRRWAGDDAWRLGTRRSALAMNQSAGVARRLSSLSRRPVELVEITTLGDRSSRPVAELGGTGVFVSALRDALAHGDVDLVVHSFKDLPVETPAGIVLAAVPAREDPRDALVSATRSRLSELPTGTRIGTSSPRRTLELERLGLDHVVVPVRGNVDTRIKKLEAGEVDALIVAVAGLCRLGLSELITERLDPAVMLPAPAQGALAIECRADDTELREATALLDDPDTRLMVSAERSFLATLGLGCTAPVGAHARLVAGTTEVLMLEGLACTDQDRAIRVSARGETNAPEALGRSLAEVVRRAGTTVHPKDLQ
jgi:hydroxymethylbilane synthase